MSSIFAHIPILAKSELFKGLGTQQIQETCKAGKIVSLKKQEFFFNQGDLAAKVYVLLEGRGKITQLTSDGQQVFYRLLGPSDIFGVIALGMGHYPVSAQAERSSRAYYWETPELLRLMEQFPRIAINSVKILSFRVQDLQEQFRELATEKVERRIAHILVRLAAKTGKQDKIGVLIDFRLSRQDLAEMTGTTLFTVSRILKHWEKDRLVKVGREQVHILSPHGLVKIAEDL